MSQRGNAARARRQKKNPLVTVSELEHGDVFARAKAGEASFLEFFVYLNPFECESEGVIRRLDPEPGGCVRRIAFTVGEEDRTLSSEMVVRLAPFTLN